MFNKPAAGETNGDSHQHKPRMVDHDAAQRCRQASTYMQTSIAGNNKETYVFD